MLLHHERLGDFAYVAAFHALRISIDLNGSHFLSSSEMEKGHARAPRLYPQAILLHFYNARDTVEDKQNLIKILGLKRAHDIPLASDNLVDAFAMTDRSAANGRRRNQFSPLTAAR